MAKKVLVIEDEKDLARLLEIHLADLGLEVSTSSDGLEGLELASRGGWDLVILDIMLPGIDGLEICRRIRGGGEYVPVVMLTARDSELDRVLGLELGADDYVTKPFSVPELLARVKALFRRAEAMGGEPAPGGRSRIVAGEVEIDREKRKVTAAGRVVELTATEFALLEQLALHPGRVYSRAQLLDLVWGYTHDGYEHTVISHINRLRGKIEEDPSRPRHVLTVRGAGYKFAETG